MSTNLKNPTPRRWVTELAARTDETTTEAVTEAIQEKLRPPESGRNTPLSEHLLALGRDSAIFLREPYLSADHGHMLYDAAGLPK